MQKKLLCEIQAHPWASSLADGLELVSFLIFFVGFCLWQYFIEGLLLCWLQPRTLCYVVSVLICSFFCGSPRLYFLYVFCYSLRLQCHFTFWARFMFHTLGADVFAYACVLSTTSRHMSAWRVTSAYHRPAFGCLISSGCILSFHSTLDLPRRRILILGSVPLASLAFSDIYFPVYVVCHWPVFAFQDLEDAAQLGCSLFDWKFQLRESSDRFEAIRQRRLATVITSPRG